MPKCEICESTDFKLIATDMREGLGRICQCENCGLVIQDLQMSESELAKYYNDEYTITNSLETGKKLDVREHFNKRMTTVQSLVQCIEPFLKKNIRVLDVGCGTGDWLYAIKPMVAEVVGVELNKDFVAFMGAELGIKAYSQDVNKIDFGNQKFDLIISHGALDHMHNPSETLQTMKRLLSPNGQIYLMVPNRNEAMNFFLPEPNRSKFNKFFWHKAHFFYFTSDSLVKLMQKNGFECQISYRHQYSFQNFLNWYYRGEPQKSFSQASTIKGLFEGTSDFEMEMNKMMIDMEDRFHQILKKTMRSDMLCCLAHVKQKNKI